MRLPLRANPEIPNPAAIGILSLFAVFAQLNFPSSSSSLIIPWLNHCWSPPPLPYHRVPLQNQDSQAKPSGNVWVIPHLHPSLMRSLGLISLRTLRHYFGSVQRQPLLSQVFSKPICRAMATSAAAKRLEGKTIVITGASSGIGRSTAFEFARTAPNNLKLVLTARRIDILKDIAARISEEVGTGVKVLPVQLDVSSPDEVRKFVETLPAEFRDIDILVNNA